MDRHTPHEPEGEDDMLTRSLFLVAAAGLLLGACNQQQAAVASPPPPQQPSRYTVLFDTGSATLSTQATSTIQQASATYRNWSGANVLVAGHTDTVGSPEYNMGLSQRRANAVTASLVSTGVPRAAIISQGYGETNLPQPTADQVPDQANRSVQIGVVHMARPIMSDAEYCALLAPKVRDIARGTDPTGALGRALSDCQQGIGDYGIPFMTKYLSDNKVPVPQRA
jgi:hypothetical protein